MEMCTEKKDTHNREQGKKLCLKDWTMYACVYDVFVCVWQNGGVCMLRKMLAAQQEKTIKEEKSRARERGREREKERESFNCY